MLKMTSSQSEMAITSISLSWLQYLDRAVNTHQYRRNPLQNLSPLINPCFLFQNNVEDHVHTRPGQVRSHVPHAPQELQRIPIFLLGSEKTCALSGIKEHVLREMQPVLTRFPEVLHQLVPGVCLSDATG